MSIRLPVETEPRRFEPDQVTAALRDDLPNTLRVLADALEAGAVTSSQCSSHFHGFSQDDRVHLSVRFVVSSPIEEDDRGMHRVPLIELPVKPTGKGRSEAR